MPRSSLQAASSLSNCLHCRLLRSPITFSPSLSPSSSSSSSLSSSLDVEEKLHSSSGSGSSILLVENSSPCNRLHLLPTGVEDFNHLDNSSVSCLTSAFEPPWASTGIFDRTLSHHHVVEGEEEEVDSDMSTILEGPDFEAAYYDQSPNHSPSISVEEVAVDSKQQTCTEEAFSTFEAAAHASPRATVQLDATPSLDQAQESHLSTILEGSAFEVPETAAAATAAAAATILSPIFHGPTSKAPRESDSLLSNPINDCVAPASCIPIQRSNDSLTGHPEDLCAPQQPPPPPPPPIPELQQQQQTPLQAINTFPSSSPVATFSPCHPLPMVCSVPLPPAFAFSLPPPAPTPPSASPPPPQTTTLDSMQCGGRESHPVDTYTSPQSKLTDKPSRRFRRGSGVQLVQSIKRRISNAVQRSVSLSRRSSSFHATINIRRTRHTLQHNAGGGGGGSSANSPAESMPTKPLSQMRKLISLDFLKHSSSSSSHSSSTKSNSSGATASANADSTHFRVFLPRNTLPTVMEG